MKLGEFKMEFSSVGTGHSKFNRFGYSTYLVEDKDGNAFQVAGYRHEVMYMLMDEYGYDFYTLSIYPL